MKSSLGQDGVENLTQRSSRCHFSVAGGWNREATARRLGTAPTNPVTPIWCNRPMIFETRCAGCDKPGDPICTTCRFALVAQAPRSQQHGVIAAVPFVGRARDVVVSLKYRNRRQVARHLGGLLVNRLVELGEHDRVEVVTWAPTSQRRAHQRGFDQAEAIARTVGRQLGLPCRRLVERSTSSAPQTGRGRQARLNSGIEFRAHRSAGGKRILVIDDVVTTGATLAAVRRSLVEQGAEYVSLAAVASTPTSTGGRIRRPAASDQARTTQRGPVVVRAA